MTDVYPGIDDWDRAALDLLPGNARAGIGGGFGLALVAPLARAELVVESLAREVADIEAAGFYVARMTARRYNISTAGLSLRETRRLAAGGAAAVGCDGTDARLWAVWSALTGSTVATVRTMHPVPGGAYAVVFVAQIEWQPSRQWLTQARRILDRCVEGGAEVEATVYLAGYMRFDAAPGFDGAPLAYSVV